MPARSKECGFTLIEVLVAMTIAVILLLPLMRGFSSGAILTTRSNVESEATVIAESEIDAIGASDLTLDRPIDRDVGPFHVAASVHRYAGWRTSGTYKPIAVPYEIAVTLSWKEGAKTRSLSFRTLRLGAISPSSEE